MYTIVGDASLRYSVSNTPSPGPREKRAWIRLISEAKKCNDNAKNDEEEISSTSWL